MHTTVLLFHPNFSQSRANKLLYNAIPKHAEKRNLYELYPDFHIDVQAEQHVLEHADRIILQFPMQWYSTPPLLKQWEDDVILHGWAYGSGGFALENKEFGIAVSTGAPEYPGKTCAYTIPELLRPLEATARYLKMKYLQPFITFGVPMLSDEALAEQAKSCTHYVA